MTEALGQVVTATAAITTGLNGAFALLKNITASAVELKNRAISDQIFELQHLLMNLMNDTILLTRENETLARENTALKEQLQKKVDVKGVYFRHNLAWKKDDKGKDIGPFCPHCCEQRETLSRVYPTQNTQYRLLGLSYCDSCKAGFGIVCPPVF